METCQNCGQTIGNLETPSVHEGHIVCRSCWDRLRRAGGTANRRLIAAVGGIAVALLVAIAIGLLSGGESEEVYAGKPMADWIKALNDKDPASRLAAVTALGKMKSPLAKNAVHKAINDFDVNISVAAFSARFYEMDDDDLVATMRMLAESAKMRRDATLVLHGPFEKGIQHLGKKVAPVLPDLEATARAIAERPYPSEEEKAKLNLLRGLIRDAYRATGKN